MSGHAPPRRGLRWNTAGVATLAGLGIATRLAVVCFVVPNWQEFRFYNWQMSVTRKPEYTLRALVDRASWLPVLHDFFTRMWVLLLLALGGLSGAALRWRAAAPLERLSVLWIGLGCLELVVHDVGNERRLVFLIPPMVTMAALVVGRDRRLLHPDLARFRRAARARPGALRAGGFLPAGRLGRPTRVPLRGPARRPAGRARGRRGSGGPLR